MWDHLIPEELRERSSLRNQYLVGRHGEAGSNILHILTFEHDLTEKGRRDVMATAVALDTLPTLILASDCPRAHQSAVLISQTILAAQGSDIPVIVDPRLRERHWGIFQGMDQDNCFAVYEQDRIDPTVSSYDSEPVAKIVSRLSSLILEAERNHTGETILLETHCDIAQILGFIFTRQIENHYIDMPMMKTAQVQELRFTEAQTTETSGCLLPLETGTFCGTDLVPSFG